MRLNQALQEKAMDVRLRGKLLAEGKLTRAQIDQYLASLIDDSAGVTYTEKNNSKNLESKEND